MTTSSNCISEFSNKLDHRRGSNDDSLATVIWHLYFLYNFMYDSYFISLAERPPWRFNDALKIWPTSRAVIKLSAGSVRSRWLFNHPAPSFFRFVRSKINHLVHSHPVLIVKITSWWFYNCNYIRKIGFIKVLHCDKLWLTEYRLWRLVGHLLFYVDQDLFWLVNLSTNS